jgi:putative oxidoreductase
MALGLLIARLVLGLAMAAHGTQKLFGWFGGYGPQGTGGYLESQGYRPGVLFAWALGLGEVGSGLLTALGLLGPVGPALLISIMVVAAVVGHAGKGFFATGGGNEVPVIYSAGALALAFAGPGPLSLDALLGLERLWTPSAAWIAIAAGIVLAIVNLAVRRLPKANTAVAA